MTDPYYSDDHVTLYHGDCLELADLWTCADVLVTDPPYGRRWTSGSGMTNAEGRGRGSVANGGIANDESTATRDAALEAWVVASRSCSATHSRPDPRVRCRRSPTTRQPTRASRAPEPATAETWS